jgi:hypothetical protein
VPIGCLALREYHGVEVRRIRGLLGPRLAEGNSPTIRELAPADAVDLRFNASVGGPLRPSLQLLAQRPWRDRENFGGVAQRVPTQRAGCPSNVFVHRHCLQRAASECEQARLRGREVHTTSVVRTPGEPLALPYRKEPQIPSERPRILLVVAGDHRKFGCQIFTARDNNFFVGRSQGPLWHGHGRAGRQ